MNDEDVSSTAEKSLKVIFSHYALKNKYKIKLLKGEFLTLAGFLFLCKDFDLNLISNNSFKEKYRKKQLLIQLFKS